MGGLREEVVRRQQELRALEKRLTRSIQELKSVNRDIATGEAKARRAKKEMPEAKALRKLRHPSRSEQLRSFQIED